MRHYENTNAAESQSVYVRYVNSATQAGAAVSYYHSNSSRRMMRGGGGGGRWRIPSTPNYKKTATAVATQASAFPPSKKNRKTTLRL